MVRYLIEKTGKRCFVDCYDVFRSYANGKLPLSTLVELMKSHGGAKTRGSAYTKAIKGSKIFSNGLQSEALELIIAAPKISHETKVKAQDLLKLIGLTVRG